MPREDSLAIASAVLGVASLVMGCCVSFLALFPGIAAIICGVMGLKSTSQRPAALVGIVLGSLTVLGGCAYLGLLGFSIVAPTLSPR